MARRRKTKLLAVAATLLLRSVVLLACGGTAASTKAQPTSPLVVPLAESETVKDMAALLITALREDRRMRQKQSAFLQVESRLLPLDRQVVPKRRLSTYYGTIMVGSDPATPVRMMFDTGSSEVWMPDETCMSAECLLHTRYPRKRALLTPPKRIEVQYLSGGLSAYQSPELLTFDNDLQVLQTVDFATSMHIPVLQDIQWDGIVGLGFRNKEQRARGTVPLLDSFEEQQTLTKRGLRNQVAFSLDPSEPFISFGGVPKAKEGCHFSWIRVNPAHSYWGVTVMNVELNFADGETVKITPPEATISPPPGNSIIDSGTYLIYFPQSDLYNPLAAALEPAETHDLTETAKNNQLPTLRISFAALEENDQAPPSVVTVALTPEQYLLPSSADGGSIVGIVRDDADTPLEGWTFGQLFLKSLDTIIFDRTAVAIGVTPAAN